jgi:hypothetical protein
VAPGVPRRRDCEGPDESRTAEFNDLIVIVIAMAVALLLDLAIFAFIASH